MNNYHVIARLMMKSCDIDGIRDADRVLSAGGIVIFPTDTVYGMGCDPFNRDAVSKIYKIKNREYSKPLPVLTYSKETAKKIAYFDSYSERIANSMWPGPLTIILKIRDERLKETLNVTDKVAVRVPNHRCTLELLKLCKYIVGTSANVSGAGSAIDPRECEGIAGYDFMLDGGMITNGKESTIVEMVGKDLKIHRHGAIKEEEVLSIF